jgi:diadenosine tetraphosphatase ApaH/serine/threonine PP2A family protein phosphatase
LAHISYEFTRRTIDVQSRRFLLSLPFSLDLRPAGGHAAGPRLVLVHGTPMLNTLYWTEDRPDSFCLKMAEAVSLKSGDVIAFGHTHKPWHREVEGIHFINTGSVGRPKDGDPRAGYVLLDLTPGQRPLIDFVRIDYDVEAASAAVIAAGLPHEFADFLRAGGVTPAEASA